MELWIRSQDKEKLLLIKGIELVNSGYDGRHQIFMIWQNSYQCLGEYKSKERVLKILDEIQKLLIKNENNEWCCDKLTNSIVYEMPED